jgi:hypothetical protein
MLLSAFLQWQSASAAKIYHEATLKAERGWHGGVVVVLMPSAGSELAFSGGRPRCHVLIRAIPQRTACVLDSQTCFVTHASIVLLCCYLRLIVSNANPEQYPDIERESAYYV